jgi:hypothetical protein
LAEPLVTILHLGYAFVPLGFLLVATSFLLPATVYPIAAIHAWTAGGIGTMTLAVMTRASLGHSGRPLTADRWTIGDLCPGRCRGARPRRRRHQPRLSRPPAPRRHPLGARLRHLRRRLLAGAHAPASERSALSGRSSTVAARSGPAACLIRARMCESTLTSLASPRWLRHALETGRSLTTNRLVSLRRLNFAASVA